MRPARLAALSIILLVACREGTAVTTTSPAPATTVPNQAVEVRTLAFSYWDAFNAYDADRVLSYLEDGYRAIREDTIRAEIGQIDTFGVQLGVEEESPPVLLGEDEAEMYVALRNPLGVRRIHMTFALIDGTWIITFAEAVD